MKSPIKHLSLLIILSVLACSNHEKSLRNEYLQLRAKPVVIPSPGHDSVLVSTKNDSSIYRLVFYVDSIGCTGCKIKNFAEKELLARQDSLFKRIQLTYIIDIDSARKPDVINLLCRYRIEGDVRIDTQKLFVHKNPHFPDNPVFHTFLLNKKDSVILVGDPFTNTRIRYLLKSLINERG